MVKQKLQPSKSHKSPSHRSSVAHPAVPYRHTTSHSFAHNGICPAINRHPHHLHTRPIHRKFNVVIATLARIIVHTTVTKIEFVNHLPAVAPSADCWGRKNVVSTIEVVSQLAVTSPSCHCNRSFIGPGPLHTPQPSYSQSTVVADFVAHRMSHECQSNHNRRWRLDRWSACKRPSSQMPSPSSSSARAQASTVHPTGTRTGGL